MMKIEVSFFLLFQHTQGETLRIYPQGLTFKWAVSYAGTFNIHVKFKEPKFHRNAELVHYVSEVIEVTEVTEVTKNS